MDLSLDHLSATFPHLLAPYTNRFGKSNSIVIYKSIQNYIHLLQVVADKIDNVIKISNISYHTGCPKTKIHRKKEVN